METYDESFYEVVSNVNNKSSLLSFYFFVCKLEYILNVKCAYIIIVVRVEFLWEYHRIFKPTERNYNFRKGKG